MFTKIAIPLDGSRLAEKAVPFAVKLALRLDASLLLLRVVETFAVVDTADKELDSLFAAEAYLKDVSAIITDPTAPLSLPSDRVQCMAVYGNPSDVVADLVPFEGADMIVMATHGRSGFSRLMLGSVATRIIHECSVPVILIRPENTKNTRLLVEEMADPAFASVDSNGTILVTLDGTTQAEAILAPAVTLAQKLHLSVTLLQVITPTESTAFGYRDLPDNRQGSIEVEDAVYTYLSQKQANIRAQGVDCVSAMPESVSVAHTVAAYANEPNVVLVAIGTHHRGRVGGFVLGSIASSVLHKSSHPMLQVWSEEPNQTVAPEAATTTV